MFKFKINHEYPPFTKGYNFEYVKNNNNEF